MSGKFYTECGRCLEMARCLPVQFECLGTPFTETLCLTCRLVAPDHNDKLRYCWSRRDEWIHLPTIWPIYAATGDDQLRAP